MNFKNYYLFLKYTIFTPSFSFKNRFFIEKINKSKNLYVSFEQTSKSFTWTQNLNSNLTYFWPTNVFYRFLLMLVFTLFIFFFWNELTVITFKSTFGCTINYVFWRIFDEIYFILIQFQYLVITFTVKLVFFIINILTANNFNFIKWMNKNHAEFVIVNRKIPTRSLKLYSYSPATKKIDQLFRGADLLDNQLNFIKSLYENQYLISTSFIFDSNFKKDVNLTITEILKKQNFKQNVYYKNIPNFAQTTQQLETESTFKLYQKLSFNNLLGQGNLLNKDKKFYKLLKWNQQALPYKNSDVINLNYTIDNKNLTEWLLFRFKFFSNTYKFLNKFNLFKINKLNTQLTYKNQLYLDNLSNVWKLSSPLFFTNLNLFKNITFVQKLINVKSYNYPTPLKLKKNYLI